MLREQAVVEDSTVEVQTKELGKRDVGVIPAGSRDEWGTVLTDVLNVGNTQLPPEGRAYGVASA